MPVVEGLNNTENYVYPARVSNPAPVYIKNPHPAFPPAALPISGDLPRDQDGQVPNRTKLAETIEVTTKAIQCDIDYMRNQMSVPIEFGFGEPDSIVRSRLGSIFEFRESLAAGS